ncbi:receptor protein [Salix suchowensis]|nr:receptor protein [Salix suchowensis]
MGTTTTSALFSYADLLFGNLSIIAAPAFWDSLIDRSDWLLSRIGEDRQELGIPYFDFYPGNYSSFFLKGDINPSLLDLKHLEYLDLSMNDLSSSSTIPGFICPLIKLKYLNLSPAGFLAKVPVHLANHSIWLRMHSLALSIHSNEFDGEIPLESCHLSQLRVLNLANVSAMIGEARECEYWLYAGKYDENALVTCHIPSGNQLKTSDDKCIYIGNDGLCGHPMKSCPEDENPLKVMNELRTRLMISREHVGSPMV